MRVRRIKINNFRNLRDIEIFPSKTSVIIGENNTGKSNLIHALRLILDLNSRRLESELSESDINSTAYTAGIREFTILVEIGDLQRNQELETIFKDRLCVDNNETYISIEGKFYLDSSLNNYIWEVNLLPDVQRQNNPLPLYPSQAQYIPLFFLDAVRESGREMRARGRGILAELLKEIKLDDVKDDVVNHIKGANTSLQKNNEIKSLAGSISNLLTPFIAGGQGIISLNVATEDPTNLVKNLNLRLKRQTDQREYDMSQHGTGLQNLVLISMFRHKIIQSGIKSPILAIEEPEAHLHPQSQVSLFRELNNIETPVFLTTHSPTLVDQASPMDVILFRKENTGEIEIHQLDNQLISEDDLKLYSKFIRLGSSYSLFARALIIVEGISEAILLQAFAKVMGENLDRDGVSIVPAHGGSFAFLLNVCNESHFSIPTIILFDTDVLFEHNDLLKEAYSAGLISENQCNYWKNFEDNARQKDERQKVLEGIGWIPVCNNLEEELANGGYLDTVLQFIMDSGMDQSFNRFLQNKGLTNDSLGIASYINKSRKGKSLKIGLAYRIADEARTKKIVPLCFQKAITKALKI